MYFILIFLPILPIYYAYVFKKKKNAIKNLCDKVVLITGASSGLGEACSLRFYKAGCKLILCSRNIKQLMNVKNNLLRLKINNIHIPEIIQLDLSKHSSLKGIAESILLKFNRVDILINNAGVSFRGSCPDTPLDIHKQIMDINYFGQIEFTQAFLPHWMENKSGHVVFIGSLQSKLSLPNRSAYGASKHALQSYADCLRAELSIYNINVTNILPSYIQTNLSINAFTSDGTTYNAMDDSQRHGIRTDDAAEQVLSAVATVTKEVLISSPLYKFVIYARNLLPDFYFYLMSRRIKKLPLHS